VLLVVRTSEAVLRSFALATDSRASPEALLCRRRLGFLSGGGGTIAFKVAARLFDRVLLPYHKIVVGDFIGLFELFQLWDGPGLLRMSSQVGSNNAID